MIRYDIKVNEFYNNLNHDRQHEFFYQSQYKFVPNIDNIYYTVSLHDDENGNKKLIRLFHELDRLKKLVVETKQSQDFLDGLEVSLKSFQMYDYCLSATDLYDIFILPYLPNEDTPRFLIQIRSYGLWLNSYEHMINMSFEHIKSICSLYNLEIRQVMENRIDYCYHTNVIKDPEVIFSDIKLKNSLKTNMSRYHVTGYVENYEDGRTKLTKDYFALGVRKSNNIFIRFYNKALEVIEQGYKDYFFEIWLKNGLISNYDKFCFEYAYTKRDYNYIYHAQLEFYILHGNDNTIKLEFRKALDSNIHKDIKELATYHMPSVTKVMNIEFETKRKFYYYSDQQINSLFQVKQRDYEVDNKLERLYKIFDNRHVFLDYLTSESVCFVKKDRSGYLDFWRRLRCVKLDNIVNVDAKLLRDYSQKLNKEVVARRLIGSIASNAVYNNKTEESGFLEDITDILSNINDNDKYRLEVSYKNADGISSESLYSRYIRDYNHKKYKTLKRLRNRLKKE